MSHVARHHALRVESEFLTGVRANLSQFSARLLRGSWFQHSERDLAENVRAALVDRGLFDRELLKEMPLGRVYVQRGFERRFIFGKREVSLTIASVLAPPAPLLDNDADPPPATLAEVTAHVRKLAGGSRTPTLIAVCSPSGFEPEVWNARLDLPNCRVVLAAPRPEAEGWKVQASSANIDERLLRLFDPEMVADKFKRIRKELEECGGDLLTGGVSARSLAARLDLPIRLVEGAVEMIARADPELRVTRKSGETLLYRGAPLDDAQEADAMSVTDWVRSLFSRKGEEARKINMLSERRARLAQRRDRFYEDIGRLESKESQLSEEGKRNASPVVRRRLAAQISQLRKEISRHNTTAAMLNQQINVISTHIHNLTLIQHGQMAKLPDAEELTQDAVRAEEMLEQLRADAELVTGLETGAAETMLTEDEAAILREFEAADAARTAPQTVPPLPEAAVAARPEPEPRRTERAGPAAE